MSRDFFWKEETMSRKHYIFGKNRQGVSLSNQDLYVLKHLWNHRLMSTSQLIKVDTYFSKNHENTVRNKLRRWEKFELVVSGEYRFGQVGQKYKYYRIGTMGVDILFQEGLLTEQDRKVPIKRFFQVKNIDHAVATQEVVTDVLIRSKEKGAALDSYSWSNYPYHDKNSSTKSILLYPDWILVNGGYHVNLEIDSGSEQLSEIKDKINKYMEYSAQNPEQQHTVVISVIDDTIRSNNEYGKDRSKRIAGIKHAIRDMPGLSESKLQVYVLSLARTASLILQLFAAEKPLHPFERVGVLNECVDTWTIQNEYFIYEIESKTEDIYPNNMENSLKGDAHLLFRDRGLEKDYHILAVVMEEGNVKDLDRLCFLTMFLNQRRFTSTVYKIIAIYQSEDEFTADIIGCSLDNVLFGSTELWRNTLDKTPIFFRTISPFRMEECKFE